MFVLNRFGRFAVVPISVLKEVVWLGREACEVEDRFVRKYFGPSNKLKISLRVPSIAVSNGWCTHRRQFFVDGVDSSVLLARLGLCQANRFRYPGPHIPPPE